MSKMEEIRELRGLVEEAKIGATHVNEEIRGKDAEIERLRQQYKNRGESLQQQARYYLDAQAEVDAQRKLIAELEANLGNCRIMLVKLSRKPDRYTPEEIRDAALRWCGPGDILRKSLEGE